MDLIDRLMELSNKTAKLLPQLATEEATKNALVMPLINALGYNVFDPTEVVPEFTADVGIKKGEKVDYAIFREGKPIILIECKASIADLDKDHASQLYRYFSVTEARFGILTNGVVYRVFSDLEAPNKMDSRPFLEFSLLDINDEVADQLKKFTKESYNLDEILSTASDLKYTKGIKATLLEEWANPSDEFVRMMTKRVYQGMLTQATREQFTGIVARAFRGFVTDRVNERLKSALSTEPETFRPGVGPIQPPPVESTADNLIVTTEDEIQGYYIVKSIVCEIVSPQRVFIRDTQSYCGILFDDNNRRPICRLLFNGTQKFLGLFDAQKQLIRHPIADVSDIYRFAGELKQTVMRYLSPVDASTTSVDVGIDVTGADSPAMGN